MHDTLTIKPARAPVPMSEYDVPGVSEESQNPERDRVRVGSIAELGVSKVSPKADLKIRPRRVRERMPAIPLSAQATAIIS